MLVVCVLALTIAGLAAGIPTPEPPNGIRQCARSECPVYTELETFGPDIFKRRIEPGKWARSVAPTCNRTAAVGLVYLDLHNYYMDNGISRTTPIMLEVSKNKARSAFCPDQSERFPCCTEIYTLIFYIPAASQATAPVPSKESGVSLLNATAPQEFYGITFDGRPIDNNVTEKYNQLADYLEQQELRFEDDDFIVATYDAPFRPPPHRNEILIPIKKHRKRGNNDRVNNGNGDQNNQDQGQDQGQGRGRRQRRNVGAFSNIDLIPF
nr:uncharacterized protein LOC129278229 [Lytechinus pictus]